MNLSNTTHRQAVRDYFSMLSGQVIKLSLSECEVINSILRDLYNDLGSFSWIKMTFTSALDAYWKIKDLPEAVTLQHEGSIGSCIQRVVAARQFLRAPAYAINSYVTEPPVNATNYWHNYKDPYPPPNIDNMDEPYRRFFLLLKDLVSQMDAKGDPAIAVTFLATIMAAVALSYPTSYLDTDTYFQVYVKDDVMGDLIDDDYTYYLCRMMDYAIFNRF